MSRAAWNALATVCLLIGVLLGFVPLVQWFAMNHRNGLVHLLFGFQDGSWVWGTPLIVIGVAACGLLFFGTQGDKARR